MSLKKLDMERTGYPSGGGRLVVTDKIAVLHS
jgi:hypothetical protein